MNETMDERFERRSATMFEALQNVARASSQNENEVKKLISDLGELRRCLESRSSAIEATLKEKMRGIEPRVDRIIEQQTTTQLAKANQQLQAAAQSLVKASNEVSGLLWMLPAASLISVALGIVLMLYFVMPSTSEIEQRRTEMTKLNRDIKQAETHLALHSLVQPCGRQYCIRIFPNQRPVSLRSHPGETYQIIWSEKKSK